MTRSVWKTAIPVISLVLFGLVNLSLLQKRTILLTRVKVTNTEKTNTTVINSGKLSGEECFLLLVNTDCSGENFSGCQGTMVFPHSRGYAQTGFYD